MIQTTLSEVPSSPSPFGLPMAEVPRATTPEPPAESPAAWVEGCVLTGFTPSEAVTLMQRLPEFLGSLSCRIVAPERLLAQEPPADDELVVLPWREDGDALVLLQHLRQSRITAPALLVTTGAFFGADAMLDTLGPVEIVTFEGSSSFELWRSLGQLRRALARERELRELRGEAETLRARLGRQQKEMGYLTYSLAAREIDDELLGERADGRALSHLQKRIRRSERYNVPLTCFLVGVDDLEQIRSSCSPSFAAFVLVQIALRLKLTLRESDFLWRFGEDGFILLSSASTDEAVYSQSQRLIAAVAAEVLEEEGHQVRPSISIGAARHRPELSSSNELLDVAKLALGAARNQGRGQLVVV